MLLGIGVLTTCQELGNSLTGLTVISEDVFTKLLFKCIKGACPWAPPRSDVFFPKHLGDPMSEIDLFCLGPT